MRLSSSVSHLPIVASLVAGLLAPSLGGCDTGLQATLDQKRVERFAAARTAVAQIEVERNKLLSDTIPKQGPELPPGTEIVPLQDGKGSITLIDHAGKVAATQDEKPVADGEYVAQDGTKITVAGGIATNGGDVIRIYATKPHPLASWRRQVTTRGDERTLALLAKHAKPLPEMKMTVGARGTPAEVAAKLGAEFIKESDEYWAGRSHLPRYLEVLKNYPGEIEKARARVASDKIANLHENLEKEIAAIEPQVSAAKAKLDEAQAAYLAGPQDKASFAALRPFKNELHALEERLRDLNERKSHPYVESEYEFVEPPFLDEARFDQVFLHAIGWLNMSRMANQEQLYMAFWDDYEVAFGIHRTMSDDGFSAFVSRLCFVHPQLREKCHGIPHEYRGGIVHQAFLEWLRGKASGYTNVMKSGEVFKKVADRMVEVINQKVALLPKPEEDPVLPSTMAAVAGASGARAVFSEKTGVKFNDKVIAEKWTTAGVPKDVAAALEKAVTDMKDDPANRVDFQQVVFEMPGSASLLTFISGVRAFPRSIVKTVFLAGRRRIDDSMRRASMRLRLPRADDTQPMTLQFKDDKDKRQCMQLGKLGDAPTGKRPEFFLEITPTKIRGTSVTRNEETQDLVPGETVDLGSPADLEPTLKWLDANPGWVRLFMNADYSYDQATELLSKLLYKCEDQKIELEDSSQPPMTRTCGKSAQRGVTFVVAVCGVPE